MVGKSTFKVIGTGVRKTIADKTGIFLITHFGMIRLARERQEAAKMKNVGNFQCRHYSEKSLKTRLCICVCAILRIMTGQVNPRGGHSPWSLLHLLHQAAPPPPGREGNRNRDSSLVPFASYWSPTVRAICMQYPSSLHFLARSCMIMSQFHRTRLL